LGTLHQPVVELTHAAAPRGHSAREYLRPARPTNKTSLKPVERVQACGQCRVVILDEALRRRQCSSTFGLKTCPHFRAGSGLAAAGTFHPRSLEACQPASPALDHGSDRSCLACG